MTGSATSLRTHLCGQPRLGDAGTTVSVCGWVAHRRQHGQSLMFVDLRDHSGVVQCVVDGGVDVRPEYVVRVTGTVVARPEGTANPNIATGEVELHNCTVEVLSVAVTPPFPVDDRADSVDESTRLPHRYVDLRRERMQRNLRVRSTVLALRASLVPPRLRRGRDAAADAVDSGGRARFRRPVPAVPGQLLALPHARSCSSSCDGRRLDRYFQLARCLRDEDLRADRQYEFTQLDMR